MKIKTFKYILLYIFLLILSFFLYKNFVFYENYLSNFSMYTKIDNLKNKEIISFNSWLNVNWLVLWKYDKSNLLLLSWNISGSLSVLNKSKSYSYKDFYNLWNIYFIHSYKIFVNNWTWYVKLNQRAISYYNTALSIIPKYKFKKNILANLWVSKRFLNFMYVYSCDNLFVKMIFKVNNLLENINKIQNILKKQIWSLKKWKNYTFLKQCINSFENDSNKNISILYKNTTFFKNVEKWLLITLKDYQWNEVSCYKNKELITQKYKNSIDSSSKYFNNFYKTQKNLLTIFGKASIIQMTQLCKWRNKLAKKQNKQNRQMQNNFNNLNDLSQKTKPNEYHKKKKKQKDNTIRNKKWINKNKKHEDKGNKNTKSKREMNIKKLNISVQKEMNALNKQNKNLIQQIQKETSKKDYNPKSYLNKLFKNFFWDDSDFVNWKKENSLWK